MADAAANIIALPAGERLLRTVVATTAQRQAPEAVNEAVAHASRFYLEMLGILPLVTLAPKAENDK